MLSRTDVAIVGAGPYGLSIAAHLAARGVRFRIFGPPMHAWRANMPLGMHLKSRGCASNLSAPARDHTLEQFCGSIGATYSDWEQPISGELFARYGEWFQKSLVPDLDPRHVVSCESDSDGFRLRIERGETMAAKAVVVSSGYMASARIPGELEGLPPELVSHSSSHSSFESFRGKDVIVIGAGQSALESAALLREAGANPSLVARRRSIAWSEIEGERTLLQKLRAPRTALGGGWKMVFYEHPSLPFHHLPSRLRRRTVDTVLGPFGAWWLRDRVVDQLPLLLGWRLGEARSEAGCVRLRIERDSETRELTADHIIAATGYAVSPASFPFLAPGLKGAVRWQFGSPWVSRYFESSVPGLHFTGLASAYSFGPVMRFVAGASVTARRLCAYLGAQHPGSQPIAAESLEAA
jgi:cation diffusion facilitator CzcD-associated flavoprotein CzcO